MHNGSCLCGAVQYRIDAPIKMLKHCHCSQCRKAHGAAFASYGIVRREHFRFTQGAQAVALFHSSPGVSRTFCKICGANLQWFSEQRQSNWLSVALGTLDSPLGPIEQSHIHLQSCADWYCSKDLPPAPSTY